MSFKVNDLIHYETDWAKRVFKVVACNFYLYEPGKIKYDLLVIRAADKSQIGDTFTQISCESTSWTIYLDKQIKGHPLTKIFR